MTVRPDGTRRGRDRHAVERAGPRDQLRAGRGRGLVLDVGAIRDIWPATPTSSPSAAARTPGGRCAWPARSSRSAADDLIAEGKRRAAPVSGGGRGRHRLHANGRFTVAGTDRGIGLFEIPGGLRGRARQRDARARLPRTAATCARSRSIRRPARVDLVRYAAVDDVGRCDQPADRATARPTAASFRASVRRCARRAWSIRASGQTLTGIADGLRACRAPTTCRRSRPRSTRCPRPPTRSASRPAARAARRRRRPWSPVPSPTRSGPSVLSTSPTRDAVRSVAGDPRGAPQPVTARTLRGAARQIASDESTEPAMAIEKAGA